MFQYFIPATNRKPTVADLRAIGLGHLFDDDGDVKFREVTGSGPGGNPGVVFGHGLLGYFEEKQTWDDWGDFWIGYDTIPSPDQLARESQIAGEWVRINGQKWLIPKSRHFELEQDEIVGGCSLPRRYSYDRDAKTWVPSAVKREYQTLWDLSLVYIDFLSNAAEELSKEDDGSVTISNDQVDELFECAVATNYRVGKPELDLLGIYDSDSARAVLDAVIDLNGFNDLLAQLVKKKAESSLPQSGGDSSDGLGSSTKEESQLTTQA